jgi:uncharacterized cupin superfamily protein
MERIKVEKIAEDEIEKRSIRNWGIWEKEPSEFNWAYTEEEHCLIIEGRAEIDTGEETLVIEKGDYVVFPVGMKCRWKVTEGIRKYYQFRSP